MELDIRVSFYAPRGKVFVISGANESSPSYILVHPSTHLQMSHSNSPIWSRKTLGHRECERDKRRIKKGWHNNAYFYGR